MHCLHDSIDYFPTDRFDHTQYDVILDGGYLNTRHHNITVYLCIIILFFILVTPLSGYTSDISSEQSGLKESAVLVKDLRKSEHDLIEIEIEILIFSETMRKDPDYQLLLNIVHAITELQLICHYEAEILEYLDFIKDDISKLAFLVIKRNKMSRVSKLVRENFHVKIIGKNRDSLKNQEAVELAKKAAEIATNSTKTLERAIEFYNASASKSLKKY